MKLSDAELTKIKEAMALLKVKTLAQIEKHAADNRIHVDNAFVEKLLATYGNEDGFAQLLVDTMISRRNCPCAVSCAQPCNYDQWKIVTK
jgi:hypothetical protein